MLSVSNTTWAHLALLGANLIYGIGFSVAKVLMPSKILPQGFIVIRVACACALLWCTYLFGHRFRQQIARADFPRIILCAATGIAINMLLFFEGLSLTTPIHGSLMMLATPILVSILASVVLHEKFTATKLCGLVLGISGAGVLIFSRSADAVGSNVVLGDVYILINACSYALYLVLVKPLMLRYRPIVVLRYIFLFGFLMVLPFGYPQLGLIRWHTFSNTDWASLTFIVIGVTFLTYLWNIFAIKHLSSGAAGTYIYAQPLFASAISMLFFAEQLSWAKIAAAILIFCGVWLATSITAPKPA
jgi:drug/metabolite transporter (DMT)-like permease